MKMILEFEFPDDELEARAALDGTRMLFAIQEFKARLYNIVKYDISVSMEEIYKEYLVFMEDFSANYYSQNNE